ncbi:MAG: MBL fold metallo-hydrolase [Solobacterium sp.]|nr:MBL fold metallo-hydrolase [Solobacterium sp.]
MTTIRSYGHACFMITADNGYRIVFDPYETGSVPGVELPEIEAEAVYCSHGHADHSAAHRIRLSGKDLPCPFAVSYLNVPHDDQNGALRGMNRIHILEGCGLKIAHYGDLGRDLNEEEVDRLTDCDAVMIPCGGYYTIDADQAAGIIRRTAPKLAVLMHYRTDCTGYDVLMHADDVLNRIPDARKAGVSEVTVGECRGVIMLDPEQ